MNIAIEEYRGFEISYNDDWDKFECILDITNESRAKRSSLKDLRNAIDTYIKENQTFTPFYVVSAPSRYDKTERRKIIGIRKDGRFLYEGKDGKKEQVSEYNEKDWLLENKDNDSIFKSITEKRKEIQKLSEEIDEESKKIKSTTLREVKSKYITK